MSRGTRTVYPGEQNNGLSSTFQPPEEGRSVQRPKRCDKHVTQINKIIRPNWLALLKIHWRNWQFTLNGDGYPILLYVDKIKKLKKYNCRFLRETLIFFFFLSIGTIKHLRPNKLLPLYKSLQLPAKCMLLLFVNDLVNIIQPENDVIFFILKQSAGAVKYTNGISVEK